MKNVKIEKTKLFLKHELSNETCYQILLHAQDEIRFDLIFEDDSTDVTTKVIKAIIKLDPEGEPSLVLKDYSGTKVRKNIDRDMTLSDVTLVGLNYAWNI